MKIMDKIKKTLGIKEKVKCSCGNIVTTDLVIKDCHIIGQVRKKNGEVMNICCNGDEFLYN